MKIETKQEYKDANSLKEDLEYLISDLKKDLENLDINTVKKAKEEVEKGIEAYLKNLGNNCPDLKEGVIIKISTGDGISYYKKIYYSIVKVENTYFIADIISVTIGDYIKEISFTKRDKIEYDDFLTLYNKNYHETAGLDVWYKLLGCLETIPCE